MRLISIFKREVVTDTSEQSIIECIENSLSAYPIYLSQLQGAVLHNEENLRWLATGVPIHFYNGVFKSSFTSLDIQNEIEAIIQQFTDRNLSFVWQIGPSSRPFDLSERLLSLGLEHDEDEPGMALDLLMVDDVIDIPVGFTIKKVVNDEMMKDWVRVWAFGAPEAIELCQSIHLQLGYDDNQPCKYYIGLLDGEPVSTIKLFYAEGVAAIHNVVTIPEARNRGIGTTITSYALREARKEGYRIAILTSSEDGINIYKRLGFKPYCTISKYDLHI